MKIDWTKPVELYNGRQAKAVTVIAGPFSGNCYEIAGQPDSADILYHEDGSPFAVKTEWQIRNVVER